MNFFEYVFGKDSSFDKEVFEQYTVDLQHLILNDVIKVDSLIYVNHYFADDIEFPEILINLTNLDNEQTYEHYVGIGKEFTPISFIEIPNKSK